MGRSLVVSAVCAVCCLVAVTITIEKERPAAAPAVRQPALHVTTTTHIPWNTSEYRETDFIGWAESRSYHEPGAPNVPLHMNVTTALLRTVLQRQAIFWGSNPDGGFRTHVARVENGVPVAPWYSISNESLTAENFFTGVTRYDDLTPSTDYGFVIELLIHGKWYLHLNGTFRTWQEEGSLITSANPLLFGFGSCINPMWGDRSGKSLRLLASWDPGPRFFLFIGDFIYFGDERPHEPEEYVRYYRRKLRTREVIAAMRKTPWMFQFDDHEVHDDYISGGDPSTHPFHNSAMRAWDRMIADANPPIPRVPNASLAQMQYVRWHEHSYGNAHYFVCDPRSFKVKTWDLTGPLLGDMQKAALKLWLETKCRRDKLAWCFFVTPTIFSHGSYRRDLWYGNMKEQAEVLAMMTADDRAPVSILSGDSHVVGIWEVAPSVHEFTCSPLDAFGLQYPWDMPPPYRVFRDGRSYRKAMKKWPPLGNLPPPHVFAIGRGRHLHPAGFNCLVEVNTTVQGTTGTVSVRFDIIDGHKRGELWHSHVQSYSAEYKPD